MMLHIYAIVLAVVLLIGALAAIIVCVCVDIVPIIKSRGSTLMSRDSVTQEQTRMLKKSLQRTKLTSSASADFIDSVQGRKGRGQALRNERPRYGSTPLALLSGEDEKSEEISYKTTTVIIEALPKKSTSDNNKVDDVESNEKVENQNSAVEDNGNEIPTRYETRNEMNRLKSRSGSSPNVATKRSNSMDFLDQNTELSKEIQTYNSRDPGIYEARTQSSGYPSPSTAVTRKLQSITLDNRGHSSRDRIERGNILEDTLHSHYNHHPTKSRGSASNETNFTENSDDGSTYPTNSGSPHCHWCVMERGKHVASHERRLTFPRNENYEGNSSPRPKTHQMHRQRSLEDSESGIYPKGFPYDKNKYCKNPHRGYSPCPDCFHTNSTPYYMHGYQADGTSPNDFGCQGLPLKGPIQGTVPHLISTSSSSSSSGSSSRFRHLRQPLEDIQEDASDCYAIRDVAATSTIDSRDLESGPDDGTIPKSTDNSVTSASPIIVSQTHTPVIPNSAT